MNNTIRRKDLPRIFMMVTGIFVALTVWGMEARAGQGEGQANGVNPYYGSFSTDVPIAVPAYHGLAPRLKLMYNSGGRNSPFGVGWGMSGISVIQRGCPGGGAPRYDDSDVFYLDGMELVPSTLQGGTHCTRIQNYTRIVRDAENNRWYMWGTNGNKATYAPVFDTVKGTFRWRLSRLEDPRGNVVTYNSPLCNETQGPHATTICPFESISYNGTVITFHREERPDPITFATGAGLGRTDHRFKTIDIQTGGSRVRAYKLTYTTSQSISRSLLSSVQQFGNDATLDASGTVTGGTSLPAMTFVSEANDGVGFGTGGENSFNWESGGWAAVDYAWESYFPDVNGDGKADWIIRKRPGADDVWQHVYDAYSGVYQYTTNTITGVTRTDMDPQSPNTPPEYGEDVDWTYIPETEEWELGWFHYIDPLYGYQYSIGPTGEQRDDLNPLLRPEQDNSIRVALSNGDGTFGDGDFNTIFFWDKTDADRPSYFPDVNGDGKADLILGPMPACEVDWASDSACQLDPYLGTLDPECVERCEEDTKGIRVALSNGDGTFGGNDSESRFTAVHAWSEVDDGWASHFADVNGDGMADWIVAAVYKWGTVNHGIRVALSNGDGTFGTNNDFDVTLNWSNVKGSEWISTFADVNGDGMADWITSASADKDGVRVALSNGDGTFGTNNDFDGETMWGMSDIDWVQSFADVNGDGMVDWILTPRTNESQKGIYVALSRGDGTFGTGVENGFHSIQEWSDVDDSGEWIPRFMDVNSDGMTDLVLVSSFKLGSPSRGIRVALSNGDGSFGTGVENGFHADFKWSEANSIGWGHYFGDVDGNGKIDWIISPSMGDTERGIKVALSSEPMPGLLTSFSNGIGGTTTLEYTPSSAWENTYLPLGMILQTLSGVTTSDGRENTSTASYKYAGGLWSAVERRFLGFRKVTAVIDPQGNFTETYYFQRVGSISKPEFTYYKDNQENIYRYSEHVYTENTDPPYTSLLTERWDFECNQGENCMKSLVEFGYDQYGNVIATYEYGDYDVAGDERTSVRGYSPNDTDYIVGFPAYENTYAGIGTGGQLLEQKLYHYDGNSTHLAPPTKGNVTEVLKWNNQTGGYASVRMQYDQWGNQISETDERENTSFTTFDATYHIYPEEKCNALGHCITYTWDMVMGLKTSSTDPNNATTGSTYDPLGRPLFKTDPYEHVTEFQYLDWGDPNLQRIRKIVPDGTADGLWIAVYQDGLGREYKTVKEGGSTREIEYVDTSKRVWRESLWHGAGDAPKWITYTYDGLGRKRTATNPDGTMSQIVYAMDSNGKPYTASYDELQNPDEEDAKKVVWKDAYGNITQVREKNGSEYYYTTYEYDLLKNLLRVVNNVGEISTFTWDSLGRKLASSDPEMGAWSYTYDDAGLLLTQTDAKDQTITMDYDDLGRIETKTWPDGKKTEYFYDEEGYGASTGRLTREVYPSGSETHTWDKRGLETKVTRCVDGTCKTIEQSYDALGRVETITYPDGEVVTNVYNQEGRLSSVTGYVNMMTWNTGGQLLSMSFPNGTSAAFTYNNDRLWLESAVVTGPNDTLYQASYACDAAARITAISSSTNPFLNLGFTYDDLNRLTGVSGSQTQTFEYDSVGNRVYANLEHPHVSGVTNADYTYDANGNMTSDGNRTFSWDYDNRLTSIQKGGITSSFLYNTDGARIQKTNSQGATTQYFGSLVKVVNGNLVKYYYAGPILVAKKEASDITWYHSDHLGSIRLMTNISGQEVKAYDYAAFGRTVDETGTASNERGFTGHVSEGGVGLIYMGARYYDPLLGRFISPDSIVPDPFNPQSLNRYAYCLNNPISNIDPTGHEAVTWAAIGTAALYIIETAPVWAPYVGYAGLAVTIVGYGTHNKYLMTIGSVMMGFSAGFAGPLLGGGWWGGLLGASVAGVTSPLSPLDSDVKQAIGWAYTACGLISWGINSLESYYTFDFGESEGWLVATEAAEGLGVDDRLIDGSFYGSQLRYYNRKTDDILGRLDYNHGYLYSTEMEQSLGMNASSGMRLDYATEIERKFHLYNVIPNPEGISHTEIMRYFDEIRNTGIWFPLFNDCHTKIARTLSHFGLQNPGAPGGRWGTILNLLPIDSGF